MAALIDFPRWLFCAALLYAPLAYGCTEPVSILGLNILLALSLGGWLITLAIQGEWPAIHPAPVILVGALLALGWWMTFNARSLYDPVFNRFVLLPGSRAPLPGSIEKALSIQWMLRETTLLGSLLFVADLARRPVWQWRLFQTIGLVGAGFALFGLIQKASHTQIISWGPFDPIPTSFSTYYYHGNAGAFLNLVFPPVACLALRTIARTGQPFRRTLWISALAIVLAAEAVITSRAAQGIACALSLGLIVWPGRQLFLGSWRSDRKLTLAFLATGALATAVLVASIGLAQPAARWLGTDLRFFSGEGRWLAAGAGLKSVPDAGFFGFGPGVFRVVFPYYTAYLGKRIAGVWEYLHEDYIQTLIEWGWGGTVLWGTLYFGGMAGAAERYVRRSPEKLGRRQRLLLSGLLLALGGVSLHALVDFPWQIASIQLYCVTYLGICWSSLKWAPGLSPAGCRLGGDARGAV